MARTINLIVIHCAATPNGRQLARNDKQTAAGVINVWHSQRGFRRSGPRAADFNPHLKSIGYHYVLDVDGRKSTGRHPDEVGAHVQGHNANSIGVCLAGTDRFTSVQWSALHSLVKALRAQFPAARIVGHRDLSPDRNGDGKITPDEWTKTCPGFTVAEWLAGGMAPLAAHLLG
ncbi:N-acetylmuramoyl-L-alanine amidase [Chromobacterium haemolyticum]|uniref:N-acetylmuramoyl-L-alanine amidase n=1 Tax=Chromobacterium fluminis TaxID=3044269 RepID=A0ABX0LAB8_9NEIS|nr:N-acetylmuramoyl-L-alanine amidase [Chromobacterium haemolyticum]NHR06507.1 N-acetylmuramoyl-L-alanine amidase [Chromobacterium haemolyticum]